MRRVALAASLLTSAILLGGCGNGNVIGSTAPTPAPPITPKVANEFAIGSGTTTPTGIAKGSDGFLYITERATSKIAKVTTAGSVTEYATKTANAQPLGITAIGASGTLWFSEFAANQLATITTAGVVTEYPITTPASGPTYLATGPDNNIWFSETSVNKVGVMSQTGTMIAEYALPGAPNSLVAGPDGAMWITLSNSAIVRVTTSGSVGAPIPTLTANANPMSIVLGPDGALWFTENSAGKLGRVTTAGSMSEFPLGAGVAPAGLIVGVDNNFYFGDTNKHIGQFVINTSKVTLFPSGGDATNLTLGPDLEVYFTEPGANKMGQFLYF